MNSNNPDQHSIDRSHPHCPLCLSKELKPFQPGKYSGILTNCKHCKLIFSTAFPTENELNTFYNSYPDYPELSPLTIKRYHEILDSLEKFRKTNRLMDVGCGHGHFLEEAKKRGWEVYGTEFTEKAIRICESKGIKMELGELNDNTFKGITFDVITSIEVIEHVNQIRDHLKQYAVHLALEGALYITTPNFNSLSRYIMKNNWRVITYPEHLNYFTARSLSGFLKNEKLRITSLSTTGLSVSEISAFLRHKKSGNDLQNSVLHPESGNYRLRENIEKNKLKMLLKITANKILSALRLGDTIKILCVLKSKE